MAVEQFYVYQSILNHSFFSTKTAGYNVIQTNVRLIIYAELPNLIAQWQ